MKYFVRYSFPLLACNYDSSTAFLYFRRRSPLQTRSTSTTALDVDAFCVEAYIMEDNKNDTSLSVRTRRLDKEISAREWMEEIEKLEGSIHGVGAYTVVRCDATFPNGHAGNLDDIQWNIWGKDFHLDRLRLSYDMLMESQSAPQSYNFNCSSPLEQEKAVDELIHALLKSASESLVRGCNNTNTTYRSGQLYMTLMLTVLWTPSQYEQTKHINVSLPRPTIRGHATFAGPPRTSIHDVIPSPISACLALSDELTPNALAALPRRYNRNTQAVDATAKISAWCHKRRPLEDPERYKVPGMNIGEVFLLNQYKDASTFIDSLEILEGLTSNLFVIYKDGTVRTAPTPKVLPGYSRHLVMKALTKMSSDGANCTPKLVLDERAPTVQDAMAGLWSEVFVTSAIRLLIPVSRVFMPTTMSSDTSSNSHMTLIWKGDVSITSLDSLRDVEFQIGLDESSKSIL